MCVQTPVVAVNVWPTWAVPEIVGTELFVGIMSMTETVAATGRGGARPAGIRGDDGNRQRVADIRRDGNIGGSGCACDRRPRAIPLIGEGGWIVRPDASCRRQRLAHLGGSRDRWDRAVRRNDVDDGAGRRARRGRAGAETVRGRDRDGEGIPNIRGHRDVGGSRRARDRTPRAVPLVSEARRAVRPSPVGRGERLPDLRGPRERGKHRIRWHAARCRDGTCRGARRGETRPAGIRGDDGDRQRVPDVRRDGNIGGSGCPSDRRPRAIPLIGEGGWIVRPDASCRRQRLADLGGSGDRRNRAVRRNHIDDGNRGRTRSRRNSTRRNSWRRWQPSACCRHLPRREHRWKRLPLRSPSPRDSIDR